MYLTFTIPDFKCWNLVLLILWFTTLDVLLQYTSMARRPEIQTWAWNPTWKMAMAKRLDDFLDLVSQSTQKKTFCKQTGDVENPWKSMKIHQFVPNFLNGKSQPSLSTSVDVQLVELRAAFGTQVMPEFLILYRRYYEGQDDSPQSQWFIKIYPVKSMVK